MNQSKDGGCPVPTEGEEEKIRENNKKQKKRRKRKNEKEQKKKVFRVKIGLPARANGLARFLQRSQPYETSHHIGS